MRLCTLELAFELPQPKVADTWLLNEERWPGLMAEEGGCCGVEGWTSTVNCGKNKGTGFDGRMEGSFERQDWKEDVITLEIRSFRRLAITQTLYFATRELASNDILEM